jgi:DNA-binding GntR family transcriptional regulator
MRAADGLDAAVAADRRFHRELVALAASPRLSSAHEQLSADTHMLFRHHRGYPGADWVDEHRLLLEAVQRRDRHAPELVAEHVRRAALLIADELAGLPLGPARLGRRFRRRPHPQHAGDARR